MLEVMSIKLEPKRTATVHDSPEPTPNRLFRTFKEANTYLYDLQMLTIKGQFTDVTYLIRWETASTYWLLEGVIRIDFRNVSERMNLIEYATRKAVIEVEQRRDPYYAELLKTCYIGDNYRATFKGN